MKRRSAIKSLYWNIEETSTFFRPSGEEYEKAVQARREAEAKLMAILPEGGKAIFEEFMMAVGEQEMYYDEEIYAQGFALGTQLTSEAFILNKNKMNSGK